MCCRSSEWRHALCYGPANEREGKWDIVMFEPLAQSLWGVLIVGCGLFEAGYRTELVFSV